MTTDEMCSELLRLGFKEQAPASEKWKSAFFLRKSDKSLLVLVSTHGVDLLETSQTREAMTNAEGSLSVRFSDEGNRFGEYNYTHNELNVNDTVLEAAARFVEGIVLIPDFFQKTGLRRTEWGRATGDSSLSDVYYAASSGDGGPVYLSDGVWLDSNGNLEDRGR